MATPGAPRGRRQRGNAGPKAVVYEGRDTIGTSFKLTVAEHAKAHTAAATLGLSYAEYIRELIRRDPVDETGRPLWGDDIAPVAEQLGLSA